MKFSRTIALTLATICILFIVSIFNKDTPLIIKSEREKIPGHFYINRGYEYNFIKDKIRENKIKNYKKYTQVTHIQFGIDDSPNKKCTVRGNDVYNDDIICGDVKIANWKEIDHTNQLISYIWSPDSKFIISKWRLNNDTFVRSLFYRMFEEPSNCIFYITDIDMKKSFLLSANEYNCTEADVMSWYI